MLEDGMVVVAEEVHEAEGGQVVGEMVVAVVVKEMVAAVAVMVVVLGAEEVVGNIPNGPRIG